MKHISLKYGLLLFAGLTAFFLTSYFLGISENYHLRIANSIIHVAALYYGIKRWRLEYPKTRHNYVSGVAQGMYAGTVGTLLFAIFIILFLAFDTTFLNSLREMTGIGQELTPITAGIFILMEGIGVSLIGSYLLTRYVDMRLERKAKRSLYAR